jgi:glycolate oxidase FAD binding subunit
MNLAADPEPQAWVATTSSRLREAAACGRPLAVQGACSRSALLPASTAEPVVAAGYRGVVDYRPGDLCITVRSGTTLEEIDRTLQAEGQMLPFEPPRRPGATIGGAVALGWSGSRRPFSGALRDHVTGVRLLDGLGRDLRFGGPVVKNVAGFDVPRLLAGSRGALGLLLEICLRVVPAPSRERTLSCPCTVAQALAVMDGLRVGPGRVSGAAWIDGQLLLRLQGDQPPPTGLRADPLPDAEALALWAALVDQTHTFFAPREGLQLWRLSLPLGAPPLAGAADTAFDWAGALRWAWLSPDDAVRVGAWTRGLGGHASAWPPRAPEDLAPALLRLQHRLADVFDPRRILQRGRLLPALRGEG